MQSSPFQNKDINIVVVQEPARLIKSSLVFK